MRRAGDNSRVMGRMREMMGMKMARGMERKMGVKRMGVKKMEMRRMEARS